MIDDQTLERVVDFHGHMCPGLALGISAAQIALREIGPHAKDEEVVAVVETDMCGVDAIQFLTGCTFGKGNLIHRDWGKNAYTFYRRSDGRAVRIAGRPDAWPRDPEHQELFAKVRANTATPNERSRFQELHQSESHKVLRIDPDTLFEVHDVAGDPPQRARVLASVVCARCGEEMGLDVRWEESERPMTPTGHDRAEVVAFARRRLCVGADRDAEIDVLLGPESERALRRVFTVWWAGGAADPAP